MAAMAAIRLTLAEVVRVHGDAYRQMHRLATVQTVALRAIAACRTALLGGRRETCDHCGATRLTFHSCRNRHCPTCQAELFSRTFWTLRASSRHSRRQASEAVGLHHSAPPPPTAADLIK